MKSTSVLRFRLSPRSAFVAVDVHDDELFAFCLLDEETVIIRRFSNRTFVIESELRRFARRATASGFQHVVVVCEPTGIYHNNLLRTARRLGLGTALVSAEAVKKMRVIESNDDGKTDEKDPRVIALLAQMGKTLLHRILPEPYELLREYGRIYDRAEEGLMEAKGAVHPARKRLFPDLDFGNDFYFERAGRAILSCYGFNPYRIHRAGRTRVERRLRKEAPGIHRKSIDRLLKAAEESIRADLSPRIQEALEAELTQRYEDLELYEKRREEARAQLLELYREARAEDPRLPTPQAGVIGEVMLARLIAETGPLSDFASWRQVYRYLGVNLRERRSGKYRGKTKLSKKGRARGRKVLSMITLPLVKKNAIFGDYHHRKRKTMTGTEAMAASARKVLKMIVGLYRSEQQFDRNRVHRCESQFAKAA
jgi:transposase